MGGSQAIAALAYGNALDSARRVDKIFGPGNRFVTAAKRLVSADCAIDMLAGPTEALVFASRGNAKFIAADLIAQAEHDLDAISLFVTTSARFARRRWQQKSIAKSRELPKAESGQSLNPLGTEPSWSAHTVRDAIEFINRFAPEHLTLTRTEQGQFSTKFVAGQYFRWGLEHAVVPEIMAAAPIMFFPRGGAAAHPWQALALDFTKGIQRARHFARGIQATFGALGACIRQGRRSGGARPAPFGVRKMKACSPCTTQPSRQMRPYNPSLRRTHQQTASGFALKIPWAARPSCGARWPN